MPVSKLPKSTVKLLCSAQVITSVSTAVKELVENSLDAGATNIEVKLDNFGFDRIEVKDNGKGISKEDAWLMCKKSYTSKLSSFEDLNKLVSYGFRGEALNALCAVSNVSVTTITEADTIAMTYEYDSEGNVLRSKLSHIIKGTSVVAENLFKHLPVRKQFLTNGKRKSEEIKKVELVVKSLAAIHPKLRLVFTHNKFCIWQKNCVPNLKLSFSQVVPPTIVKQLCDVRHACEKVNFQMLIPAKGCNISSTCYGNPGEAVYIFINQRPVKEKFIEKLVQGEIFNYFGNEIPGGKYPTCLISITLPPDGLDVNLEPNKTRVVVVDMDIIGNILKNKLVEYYIGPLGAPKDFLDAIDEEVEKSSVKRKTDDEIVEVKIKMPKILKDANPQSIKLENDLCENPLNSQPGGQENISSNISFEEEKVTEYTQTTSISNDSFDRDKNVSMFLDGIVDNKDSHEKELATDGMVTSSNTQDQTTPNEVKGIGELEEPGASVDIGAITLSQWSRGQIQLDGNTVNSSTTVLGRKVEEDPIETSSTIVNIDSLTKSPVVNEPFTQESERSVSSQMGCKEMAGFTKFASEMANKITENSNGISFSKVASELATKWRQLQDSDKEHYNEKAKLKQKQKEKESKADSSMRDRLQKFLAKSNEKKVLKKRTFWKSVEVDLSIASLKKAIERRTGMKGEVDLHYIGSLSEDVKSAVQGSSLFVFSERRLQEALLFYNNLGSMIVPLKVLEENIQVTRENLGESLWSVLVSMETAIDVGTGSIIISDNRITSNGLRIELVKGSGECCFQITDVPLHVAFFGLEDLKEILSLIETSTEHLPLEECRPLKIISYIRAETIRLISKDDFTPSDDKNVEKFKFWLTSIKDKIKRCPHQNSIYKKLNLNDFNR